MKYTLVALAGMSVLASTAQAADLDIQIQNISHGVYFAPLFISAHNQDMYLFKLGEAASPELQAMAEGGNIAGLAEMASAMGADSVENPAQGPMSPGMTVMTSLSTSEGNTWLSVTGMMVPTNDGFVGLNSWEIPTEAGSYEFYLQGYDAGTEANDEIRGSGAPGVPGLPVLPFFDAEVGQNGTGVTTTENNPVVHIHRGSIGDTDMQGGSSDLDSSRHRWLNPVAKVTVTVN
ncbi:spondin domain-containing protein [Bowmanella denitrificans]|uniref:spondin domain-containing protein n=1 Tax=Bowmanella denitrificans TaxID=366582 RepID=UPI000C99DBD9|nr:spondin domain-containing protein [Bowmanella denitrificans]